MRNIELAKCLEEIAQLLEIKGENPFKVRAYRRAAQAISLVDEDVALVWESGRLGSLDGIGKSMEALAGEWLASGRIELLERLREEVPPGLIAVMEVPGIGPKVAMRLFRTLGVRGLDDLARALKDGKLTSVPGLGPKAEQHIARALEKLSESRGRIPLGMALEVGMQILEHVRRAPGVQRAALAGSVRRRVETVKDIDLVASAESPDEVMEHFVRLPGASEVLAKGRTKSSLRLQSGIQVDLRVVRDEQFPAALHHFTGSQAHHVRLRARAHKLGLRLSEYGIEHVETGQTECPVSEEALYEALGLSYIPPELREDRGEIELAAEGRLPQLVELGAVRGDLHVHSTWSDGDSTLEEIARAAKAKGWEYVAICDHSRSLRIAGGLGADDVRRQAEAIAAAEAAVGGIRLLRGIEVDILADGSLDLDDEVLAELDVVVASVHSGFRQSREQMTRRIVRAIENRHVDIIGHPTGRVLGRRPPYEVDVEALIEAAAKHRTALEINASPSRLDLRDRWARAARDAGVMLCVNTDAHHVEELDRMGFGIWVARRAGLEAHQVLNARSLFDLLAWCAQAKET